MTIDERVQQIIKDAARFRLLKEITQDHGGVKINSWPGSYKGQHLADELDSFAKSTSWRDKYPELVLDKPE